MLYRSALTLFLSLLIFNCFGQSKHGFETGVDSIAYKHKIKTKTAYQIIVAPGKADTTTSRICTYDKEGFLIAIDEHDWTNSRMNQSSIYDNRAEFKYNEKGYLTDEALISWTKPLTEKAWSNDIIHTTRTNQNGTELLLNEVTESYSPGSKTMDFWDSCAYFYLSDNRIDRIECVCRDKSEKFKKTSYYIYDTNKLLIGYRPEGDGIFEKMIYRYTYYK